MMAGAAGRVTIFAGRVLDVVAGVTLTDQAIVIADARIERVEPRSSVSVVEHLDSIWLDK